MNVRKHYLIMNWVHVALYDGTCSVHTHTHTKTIILRRLTLSMLGGVIYSTGLLVSAPDLSLLDQ